MLRFVLVCSLLWAVPAAAQERVTFAWDAPAEGPAPDSYRLAFGSTPGAITAWFYVGPVTEAVVEQVPVGTWYVRVYAQLLGNLSPPSNEIVVTVDPPLPSICTETPLQVTVTQWPTSSTPIAYTASHDVVGVELLRPRRRVTGAVFTDVRTCTVTVLR